MKNKQYISDFASIGLYNDIRQFIRKERKLKGLTQGALGNKVGMMQRHISEIEQGKIIPRLNTLLEILRALNGELVLVPKNLLPLVQAFLHDHQHPNSQTAASERSLYAVDDDEEDNE